MRDTLYERNTKETEIKLRLDLDGSGTSRIETGIGFFDHMLTAFALHAGFSLELQCRGDLNVDTHHTVEDIGIALGQAVSRILDDKREIARYGNFLIPMDEALAQCTVDISGRPFLVFHADFKAEKIGELETQTIGEFFRAFAMNAGITLHINLYTVITITTKRKRSLKPSGTRCVWRCRRKRAAVSYPLRGCLHDRDH